MPSLYGSFPFMSSFAKRKGAAAGRGKEGGARGPGPGGRAGQGTARQRISAPEASSAAQPARTNAEASADDDEKRQEQKDIP